jgi:hypothetical protein
MRISNSMFRPLKNTDLLLLGCSKVFARKAMAFSPIYNGNIEHFICNVEELLKMERSDPYGPDEVISNQCYTTPLNAGAMRVEYDYNGDLLTSLGYEYINNNRRA